MTFAQSFMLFALLTVCVCVCVCVCCRNGSIPSLSSVLDAAGREEYEEMAHQLSREMELETSDSGPPLSSPSPPLLPPTRYMYTTITDNQTASSGALNTTLIIRNL